MRRYRLLIAAAVLAACPIAPSAILAEEPGADSIDSAGALTAPAPEPRPVAPNPASEGSADDPVSDDSAVGRPAVGDATVVEAPAAEATLLAAGRRNRAASASATPAASVSIQDYFFSPKTVTIDVGETVKWTNAKTSEDHTATGDSFDSGVLKAGKSYTHKFSKAGSFDYVCTIHPNMTGKVVVKSASASGGSGAGESSSDGGVSDPSSESSGTGTGTGSTGSLPYTGQDLRVALVVGVNLLLAGTLLLLRSRRRAPR